MLTYCKKSNIKHVKLDFDDFFKYEKKKTHFNFDFR